MNSCLSHACRLYNCQGLAPRQLFPRPLFEIGDLWRHGVGLVEGFETELGYFDLTELSEVTVFGRVPAVERDLYWAPQTLGEIRRQSR